MDQLRMNVTTENRRVNGIMAALVMASGRHGVGTVDIFFLQGERLKEETLFFSGWRTVRPMQDVIDFMPVLNGHTVGYKVIGKSPADVSEAVRGAVLARLAANDDVSA